ncbi:unnamed protein product [Rotaria socialis]|uniref:Uncharacterized protein n=1 Tax=Rotaria socialis TaxID=392032 RepID=A0A817MH53_9BILA|nr:unnamed protein product [Rotaria socialis]CAF3342943.1 unnamed protein product [Rotaria socialis]CAF3434151.1 unnamed protein product [Rotaria socialis]CAF4793704.1 unnamed protein product [Rotaria socialis]
MAPPPMAPCNAQFGLTCDNVTQTCLRPSSIYWSYAGCESLSTYAGYCGKNESCTTQVGLFCRLPGSNTPCDCPLQSKFYTCDCQQGQTWITTTSTLGKKIAPYGTIFETNSKPSKRFRKSPR